MFSEKTLYLLTKKLHCFSLPKQNNVFCLFVPLLLFWNLCFFLYLFWNYVPNLLSVRSFEENCIVKFHSYLMFTFFPLAAIHFVSKSILTLIRSVSFPLFWPTLLEKSSFGNCERLLYWNLLHQGMRSNKILMKRSYEETKYDIFWFSFIQNLKSFSQKEKKKL